MGLFGGGKSTSKTTSNVTNDYDQRVFDENEGIISDLQTDLSGNKLASNEGDVNLSLSVTDQGATKAALDATTAFGTKFLDTIGGVTTSLFNYAGESQKGYVDALADTSNLAINSATDTALKSAGMVSSNAASAANLVASNVQTDSRAFSEKLFKLMGFALVAFVAVQWIAKRG